MSDARAGPYRGCMGGRITHILAIAEVGHEIKRLMEIPKMSDFEMGLAEFLHGEMERLQRSFAAIPIYEDPEPEEPSEPSEPEEPSEPSAMSGKVNKIMEDLQ